MYGRKRHCFRRGVPAVYRAGATLFWFWTARILPASSTEIRKANLVPLRALPAGTTASTTRVASFGLPHHSRPVWDSQFAWQMRRSAPLPSGRGRRCYMVCIASAEAALELLHLAPGYSTPKAKLRALCQSDPRRHKRSLLLQSFLRAPRATRWPAYSQPKPAQNFPSPEWSSSGLWRDVGTSIAIAFRRGWGAPKLGDFCR